MNGGISTMAKRELLATIRDRYRESSKKEKGRILDEFIAVTGNHCKHGIRLLGQSGADSEKSLTVRAAASTTRPCVRPPSWSGRPRNASAGAAQGGTAQSRGLHGASRASAP